MRALLQGLVFVVAVLAMGFLLFGCAHEPAEPVIITKEVKVAVPVPCAPKLSPRPVLMTKAQVNAALAAAPNLDEKIKIVADQLLLYMGWTPVVEAALEGCKGVGG